MLGSWLDHRLDPIIYKLSPKKSNRALHPNLLTVLGCLINLAAGGLFGFGYMVWGGIFLLIGGFFDMMDGAVARQEDRATPFGGFLDSVLDRYADQFALFGILIYFTRLQAIPWVIMTAIAIIGTTTTPYTRARAETIIDACQVGILERPERVIVLAAGALSGYLTYAVLIIMVLTNVTVLQRIYHTYRNTRV
jgi:phosphatidylglycerophosphate synthase